MPDFLENLFTDRHVQPVLQSPEVLEEQWLRVARVANRARVARIADRARNTSTADIADRARHARIGANADTAVPTRNARAAANTGTTGTVLTADMSAVTRTAASASIAAALPGDSGGPISGKAQGDSRAGGVAQQLGSRGRNGGGSGGPCGRVLASDVGSEDPRGGFRARHPRYRED